GTQLAYRLFLLLLRPPPSSTLFPYTTLFRSYPRGKERPMDIGRLGIWTSKFDTLRAAQAQEVARELEEMGYGAIWFPEAFGRERSEEHTSELQSPCNLVCRLLLEKKKETLLT